MTRFLAGVFVAFLAGVGAAQVVPVDLRQAQADADWIAVEASKSRGHVNLAAIREKADGISAAILRHLEGAPVCPEPEPCPECPEQKPCPTCPVCPEEPEPDPKLPPDPVVGPTIHVPSGGSIQAALNTAPSGATITLDPVGLYIGSVVLPLKDCASVTTLTTAGYVAVPGQRVTPADEPRLATLRSGSVQAAIRAAEGTCGWHVQALQFEANHLGQHEVVEIGQAWNTKTLEGLPRQITLSHILMDFPGPQKRCIGANGIDITIRDSHITGCWIAGQDSQAIAAWNTPGPISIRNNHLEAGSEVIMFGGAEPGISNVVPADVLVEGNTLTRPVTWRGDTSKVVKNLFEIKAGVRIVVRNNLMENHWQAAQPGWAIVFTPRSQGGRCSECRIEDVLFERNVIRNVSAGFNILYTDDTHPAGTAQRITIRDNWVQIDHAAWGGPGRFMLVQGPVQDLHVEHNTVTQTGNNVLAAYGAPSEGFRLVGNLFRPTGSIGMHTTGKDGQNHSHGVRHDGTQWVGVWQERFPGGVIEGNAFAGWQGNAASRANLPGNIFPTASDAEIVDGYGVGAVAGYGRRR